MKGDIWDKKIEKIVGVKAHEESKTKATRVTASERRNHRLLKDERVIVGRREIERREEKKKQVVKMRTSE